MDIAGRVYTLTLAKNALGSNDVLILKNIYKLSTSSDNDIILIGGE